MRIPASPTEGALARPSESRAAQRIIGSILKRTISLRLSRDRATRFCQGMLIYVPDRLCVEVSLSSFTLLRIGMSTPSMKQHLPDSGRFCESDTPREAVNYGNSGSRWNRTLDTPSNRMRNCIKPTAMVYREADGFPREDKVMPNRKTREMKRAVVLLSG